MNGTLARRAFRYLRPYQLQFWTGQVFTLIGTAAGLVFPLVTRHLVDNLLVSKDVGMLFSLLGMLAGVLAALSISNYLKDVLLGSISQLITRDLKDQVFDKLQKLTIPYYENTKSGEIVSVMTNDINRFQDSISQGLVFVISQLLSFIAITIMLCKIDLVLTLILLGLLPIALIVVRILGKRGRIASREVQDQLGEVTALLSEVIRGIDVIKTFVLDKLAISMFRSRNQRATERSVKVVKLKALNGALIGALAAIFMIVILGAGAWHVFQERITTGDLIAYIIYVQMIVGPIAMLGGIWMEVQKSFAAAERVFEVLDSEPEPAHGIRALPKRDSAKIIEFNNVTFGYKPDDPVLRGITLAVREGETVALAGSSGAGKSSLLKLILRFYPVQNGSISYHGRPLNSFDPQYIRSEVAVVMQETHLFDMTVKENILCGKPAAHDRDVARAAKQACSHEFIAQLPDGYATNIGENGVFLSGGQRQRIAIARAFLKDPRILLLDEATSSLDSESEGVVRKALQKLMFGRTTMIISHRLSTIQNADRIYVIEDGTITDRRSAKMP